MLTAALGDGNRLRRTLIQETGVGFGEDLRDEPLPLPNALNLEPDRFDRVGQLLQLLLHFSRDRRNDGRSALPDSARIGDRDRHQHREGEHDWNRKDFVRGPLTLVRRWFDDRAGD